MDRLSLMGPGRLGHRLSWLAAAAASLLIPHAVGAAPEGRPVDALAAVKELGKPVTYTETKIPLVELIAKVAADTGVPLTAARDVADEPVAVVVKAMPARELLEQLADLLDYQWHRLPRHPTPSSQPPTPAFEIYQHLASKQREEALRQARLAEVVRRFQEALKTYTEIAALSPEQLQQLAEAAKTYWREWWQTLTPEQRQARLNDPAEEKQQQRYAVVLGLQAPIPRALATLLGSLSPGQWGHWLEEGEGITWSSDPKPAEMRLPPDVERRLRDSKPSWLRSRTWFLDRPREIPLRYVRRWKELIAQRGALPLEAYLEIVTTLTDTQIESLSRLVANDALPRDLYGAELCRDMLRLYASLLPAQRETLRHGGVIPVLRMTPRQQALFVGTVKGHHRIAPPEELTPEQFDLAGLLLKQVPMIRTINRSKGGAVVSDEPAATAGSQPPRPTAAPTTVDRIPVTQVQFLLAHGQESRGGVALVTSASP